MDQYTVLYYPSFQPDLAWLRKILLLTDHVARIVPEDADTDDPTPLLDLLKVVPEGLTNLVPNPQDISLDDLSTQRLAKAFAIIGGTVRAQGDSFTITVHNDSSMSIDGHVFLHRSKVSSEIGNLLETHGLVRTNLNQLAQESFGVDHYMVVDEQASNLLLSCLADRIARRHGLDAITDRPLHYGVNALDNLSVAQLPDSPEGMLLEAIASLSIPSEVVTITPQGYKEIRDSYAEIRGAFKALVAELSLHNRLGRISNSDVLHGRVTNLARDFVAECDKWHGSRYARGFKSWTPLYVGGILSVAAAVFVESIVAAGTMATGSFVIQIVEKYITQRAGGNPKDRVYQMLIGMQRDIIRRSHLRELA